MYSGVPTGRRESICSVRGTHFFQRIRLKLTNVYKIKSFRFLLPWHCGCLPIWVKKLQLHICCIWFAKTSCIYTTLFSAAPPAGISKAKSLLHVQPPTCTIVYRNKRNQIRILTTLPFSLSLAAEPKSTNLMWPEWEMRTFSGLTSLWTKPSWWRSFSAAPNSDK